MVPLQPERNQDVSLNDSLPHAQQVGWQSWSSKRCANALTVRTVGERGRHVVSPLRHRPPAIKAEAFPGGNGLPGRSLWS